MLPELNAKFPVWVELTHDNKSIVLPAFRRQGTSVDCTGGRRAGPVREPLGWRATLSVSIEGLRDIWGESDQDNDSFGEHNIKATALWINGARIGDLDDMSAGGSVDFWRTRSDGIWWINCSDVIRRNLPSRLPELTSDLAASNALINSGDTSYAAVVRDDKHRLEVVPIRYHTSPGYDHTLVVEQTNDYCALPIDRSYFDGANFHIATILSGPVCLPLSEAVQRNYEPVIQTNYRTEFRPTLEKIGIKIPLYKGNHLGELQPAADYVNAIHNLVTDEIKTMTDQTNVELAAEVTIDGVGYFVPLRDEGTKYTYGINSLPVAKSSVVVHAVWNKGTRTVYKTGPKHIPISEWKIGKHCFDKGSYLHTSALPGTAQCAVVHELTSRIDHREKGDAIAVLTSSDGAVQYRANAYFSESSENTAYFKLSLHHNTETSRPMGDIRLTRLELPNHHTVNVEGKLAYSYSGWEDYSIEHGDLDCIAISCPMTPMLRSYYDEVKAQLELDAQSKNQPLFVELALQDCRGCTLHTILKPALAGYDANVEILINPYPDDFPELKDADELYIVATSLYTKDSHDCLVNILEAPSDSLGTLEDYRLTNDGKHAPDHWITYSYEFSENLADALKDLVTSGAINPYVPLQNDSLVQHLSNLDTRWLQANKELDNFWKGINTMNETLPQTAGTAQLSPTTPIQGAMQAIFGAISSGALTGAAIAASQAQVKATTALLQKAGVSKKALKHPLMQAFIQVGGPALLRAIAPHLPGLNTPAVIKGLDTLTATAVSSVTAKTANAVMETVIPFAGALMEMGTLAIAGETEPEADDAVHVTQVEK